MRWEALHCQQCSDPKLKKFMGRPKQYSPKARLLNFLGYKLPFDRHDWIVNRCGKEVRWAASIFVFNIHGEGQTGDSACFRK